MITLQLKVIARMNMRAVQYNKRNVITVLNNLRMEEIDDSTILVKAKKTLPTKEEMIRFRRVLEGSLRLIHRRIAYTIEFSNQNQGALQ